LTYSSETNRFTLQNKEQKDSHEFGFELSYWPAFGQWDASNSGSYIFRPLDQVYEPLNYANLTKVEVLGGEKSIKQEMILTF